jgi:hypothetical protein
MPSDELDNGGATVGNGIALAQTIALVFLTAVAINYAWEFAQAPLYEWSGESRNALWHCFVASLGDGLLVLLIFGAGWLTRGRPDWFLDPRPRDYLVMLIAGFTIAIAVELIAVHVLKRWTYTELMPRIPALEIGMMPVIQMLILPPLIFWIASRYQGGRAEK